MPPRTIYADYQATTPLDPRVAEQMAPHWREEFGNPHSNDHVIGWHAAEAVRTAATSVAGLVGADPTRWYSRPVLQKPTTLPC